MLSLTRLVSNIVHSLNLPIRQYCQPFQLIKHKQVEMVMRATISDRVKAINKYISNNYLWMPFFSQDIKLCVVCGYKSIPGNQFLLRRRCSQTSHPILDPQIISPAVRSSGRDLLVLISWEKRWDSVKVELSIGSLVHKVSVSSYCTGSEYELNKIDPAG